MQDPQGRGINCGTQYTLHATAKMCAETQEPERHGVGVSRERALSALPLDHWRVEKAVAPQRPSRQCAVECGVWRQLTGSRSVIAEFQL